MTNVADNLLTYESKCLLGDVFSHFDRFSLTSSQIYLDILKVLPKTASDICSVILTYLVNMLESFSSIIFKRKRFTQLFRQLAKMSFNQSVSNFGGKYSERSFERKKSVKINSECASLCYSGVYWVSTPSGVTETICDMDAGGWTLIGEDGLYQSNKYDTWLRAKYNTQRLKDTTITPGDYACLDAVDMAVNHATKVRQVSVFLKLGLSFFQPFLSLFALGICFCLYVSLSHTQLFVSFLDV